MHSRIIYNWSTFNLILHVVTYAMGAIVAAALAWLTIWLLLIWFSIAVF